MYSSLAQLTPPYSREQVLAMHFQPSNHTWFHFTETFWPVGVSIQGLPTKCDRETFQTKIFLVDPETDKCDNCVSIPLACLKSYTRPPIRTTYLNRLTITCLLAGANTQLISNSLQNNQFATCVADRSDRGGQIEIRRSFSGRKFHFANTWSALRDPTMPSATGAF